MIYKEQKNIPGDICSLAKYLVESVRLINEMDFRENNGVRPKIVIYKNNKGVCLPIPWMSDDEKEKENVMKVTNMVLRKLQPEVAIFTSESWFLECDDIEDLKILPRDHPDKVECVMIVAGWKKGSILRTYRIHQNGESRFVGDLYQEVIENDGSGIESFISLFEGVF